MCELIVVTNRKLCEGDFLDRIRLLCRAGVKKIVLREKDLNEKEYTKLAKDVLEICKAADVECIFHKYLFPALKLHAPGIHLPLPLAMKSSETAGELSEFGVQSILWSSFIWRMPVMWIMLFSDMSLQRIVNLIQSREGLQHWLKYVKRH